MKWYCVDVTITAGILELVFQASSLDDAKRQARAHCLECLPDTDVLNIVVVGTYDRYGAWDY